MEGRQVLRKQFIISFILALLVAFTAITGVFYRGDYDSVEVTSIRGETYMMITDGIYRYNSERIVAEGFGWDIFTLFIALPSFLILLPFLLKGSLRSRLLGIGLLAYFFYQYLMYALAWAFGPLFPAYIIIFAVSLFLAIWIASGIDLEELSQRIENDFPRKGVIVLCIIISIMLVFMWTQRIIAGLQSDWKMAMMLGQTTMVIQALDLGLIVPLALVTGFLVWKRKILGFLLSPVLMVKAVAMAGAICFMLVSAWIVEDKSQVLFLVIFGIIFLSAAYLGFLMLRRA